MKARHRRFLWIGAGVLLLGIAATLVLNGSPRLQPFVLPATFRGLVSVTFTGNDASNSATSMADALMAISPPSTGWPKK